MTSVTPESDDIIPFEGLLTPGVVRVLTTVRTDLVGQNGACRLWSFRHATGGHVFYCDITPFAGDCVFLHDLHQTLRRKFFYWHAGRGGGTLCLCTTNNRSGRVSLRNFSESLAIWAEPLAENYVCRGLPIGGGVC